VSIFKACDVRGVFGEEWDLADARRIGRSLGRMLRRRDQAAICVGGDFRRSTPAIKTALVAGLLEAGIQVDDLGQLPTPAVYFTARQTHCANLAVVTASHNPGKYNGVKFVVAGRPPLPDMIDELRGGQDANEGRERPGTVRARTAVAQYEQWVVSRSRAMALEGLRTGAGRTFGREDTSTDSRSVETREEDAGAAPPRLPRVVVDAMGGAMTGIARRALEAAGYEVSAVRDELDPDFTTRNPNPSVDANLRSLREAVADRRAGIGIALDGDGDRVMFVDHGGAIARPEQIAAWLLRRCFGRCRVVYDLKCASLVPRTVTALGGQAIMQPSGHGFIRAMMLQSRAELGVEVSGHHFFGALDGGDDGLFTALLVLDLLARTGANLADVLAAIPWPAITPDLRIAYRGDVAAAIETIAATCGGEVSRMDGVRAEYEIGGWALARASITEPAMTFRFEGRDRAHVLAIVERFLGNVPALLELVMERMS